MKNCLFIITLFLSLDSAYAWERMCGFSDEIYDYLVKENQGKKFDSKTPMTGTQGENARVLMAMNGRWLLTFEFLSDADTARDVTCIMMTNETNPGAYDLITGIVPALPNKSFGKFDLNKDTELLKEFVPYVKPPKSKLPTPQKKNLWV
jgi:hypothetical protein